MATQLAIVQVPFQVTLRAPGELREHRATVLTGTVLRVRRSGPNHLVELLQILDREDEVAHRRWLSTGHLKLVSSPLDLLAEAAE